MIVIIDNGMGNLRSVQKAFQRINIPVVITADLKTIEKADKLVLPGVGHFEQGMARLRESGLVDVLNHVVIEKKIPFLGICLGMQLMTAFSEEGSVKGLSWIPGKTIRFKPAGESGKFKIPHMGWNNIQFEINHPLLKEITENDLFYFVHSYHYEGNPDFNLCQTVYSYEFVSAVYKDNMVGVQFHPEKSHKSGLKMLKNFSEI
ncbi:MAG: imidazole glycerol phosphate synthase subunit HisH [Lentimicrobium sp.]